MRAFLPALTLGVTAAAPTWSHPGVLVGSSDLAGARERFNNKIEPTYSFFNEAAASHQGSVAYVPFGPPLNGTISCGYYGGCSTGLCRL